MALESPQKIVALDKQHLQDLIAGALDVFGNTCDLNYIDTSRITDMECLFNFSHFNGDISSWDVSNVRNMQSMFAFSSFNGDISKWDVSHVIKMDCMFHFSDFTGDITNWQPRAVLFTGSMFSDSALERQRRIPAWYQQLVYLRNRNIVN